MKALRFFTPLRCVQNHYGLAGPHKGDENVGAPGGATRRESLELRARVGICLGGGQGYKNVAPL